MAIKTNKKRASVVVFAMKQKRAKRKWDDTLLFNSAFGALTLAIILLAHSQIWLATALLAIVAITGLYYWKSKTTTAIFFLGGALCALAETTAINAGVWSYSNSNLLGAPIWIYIVWGNSSAFIYQTALGLRELLGFES